MSVYQTCLIGRTKVADGTMAFKFEKPTHFEFKPGQYIDLTIRGGPDISAGKCSSRKWDTCEIPSITLPGRLTWWRRPSKLSVMRE
jgi:hypothetical protein